LLRKNYALFTPEKRAHFWQFLEKKAFLIEEPKRALEQGESLLFGERKIETLLKKWTRRLQSLQQQTLTSGAETETQPRKKGHTSDSDTIVGDNKKIIIFLIPDLHHPRPERNIIAPK